LLRGFGKNATERRLSRPEAAFCAAASGAGIPSAAFARWRTLDEIRVVLWVLAEGDEGLIRPSLGSSHRTILTLTIWPSVQDTSTFLKTKFESPRGKSSALPSMCSVQSPVPAAGARKAR